MRRSSSNTAHTLPHGAAAPPTLDIALLAVGASSRLFRPAYLILRSIFVVFIHLSRSSAQAGKNCSIICSQGIQNR